MCELMEDHSGNVQLLASKLGKSHNLVKEMVEQHLQLEEAVNGTLRQVNETVMDSKEDWKEYRNACTDHEVPSEKDLSLGPHTPLGPRAPLGPHAPDSECSSPPRSAAAQAAQCTSATKAEPNTRKKEMQSADTDPSMDNLSLGQHAPLGPHAPDSKNSSPLETAAAQCTSATKAMQSADTDPSMDNLSLGQHAPLGPHAPESKCSSPPENAAAQAAQCTSATQAEPETRQKEIHIADKDPSMDNSDTMHFYYQGSTRYYW